MRAEATDRHRRLKQTWLRALRAGAGSLVVAAAVVAAPNVDAAIPPVQPSVETRVERARDAMQPAVEGTSADGAVGDRLAFIWGNRFGGGVRVPGGPTGPTGTIGRIGAISGPVGGTSRSARRAPRPPRPPRHPADAVLQPRLRLLLPAGSRQPRPDAARGARADIRSRGRERPRVAALHRRVARGRADGAAARVVRGRLRDGGAVRTSRASGLAFVPDQRDARRRALVRPLPALRRARRRERRRTRLPARRAPHHAQRQGYARPRGPRDGDAATGRRALPRDHRPHPRRSRLSRRAARLLRRARDRAGGVQRRGDRGPERRLDARGVRHGGALPRVHGALLRPRHRAPSRRSPCASSTP